MSLEWVFFLFNMLARFSVGISATAYIVFLYGIGFTSSDVFLLEAIYCISMFVCEIPTGMMADGRSRSWSMRVGVAIWAISTLAVWPLQSFWSLVPCFIGMGVGNAFISGAQNAWMAEVLKQAGRMEDLRLVLSRSNVWGQGAYLVGGLTGAASLLVDMRFQWIIAGTAVALMFPVVHFFMEGKGDPQHRLKDLDALRKGLAATRDSFALRWAGAGVLLFAFFFVIQLQWAQKVFVTKGILGLSWIWFLTALAPMLGSYIIRSKRFAHGREVIAVVAALGIVGMVMMALPFTTNGVLMCALLFAWQFSRGMHGPAMETFVQERIESEYRATYGSLQSFLLSVGKAGVFLIAAAVADGQADLSSTHTVLLVCGSLLLVGTVALAWSGRRAMHAPAAQVVGVEG